jgi:hypothetical protein
MSMDPRAKEAQSLFWELADPLGQLDAPERIRKRVRMAELHESLGRELLRRGDLDGWIDIFAGITAWGKAGRVDESLRMIAEGRGLARSFPEQERGLLKELDNLESWLKELSEAPPGPTTAPGAADGLANPVHQPEQHPEVT